MSTIEPVRRYRNSIPKQHQASIDTRLAWLWHQKFGTVQMIHQVSQDTLDRTATTLILQAILTKDLASIDILLNRLEGGPQVDAVLVEGPLPI